jgi:hypothetical protein
MSESLSAAVARIGRIPLWRVEEILRDAASEAKRKPTTNKGQ